MTWPMHVQEIYEQHMNPLSMVDQLRLIELIAHELVVTVHDVSQSKSLLDLE